MDWGELSQRPFAAEVWGTVAEWAGAFGTVSAVAVALWSASRDRRINARLQAQQIVLRHDAAGSDVLIQNLSAQPIFKAQLRWHIARFKPPKGVELSNPRREIEANLGANAEEWDVIEPGELTRSLHLHSQPMVIDIFFIPRLTFQDVRGQMWKIEPLGVGNGKPKKIRRHRLLRRLASSPAVSTAVMTVSVGWELLRLKIFERKKG